MPRVFLALLVLFGAPACQQAGASRKSTSAADRAVAVRLDALEHQMGTIRATDRRLSRSTASASRQMVALSHRLDATVATLDRLKTKLGGAVSAADGATSLATQAAARAADLARQLAILEKRFDYHLKHSSGA
jgi:ABC-type transporter Mla subunit MlaD